jgi:hypothetical protein
MLAAIGYVYNTYHRIWLIYVENRHFVMLKRHLNSELLLMSKPW